MFMSGIFSGAGLSHLKPEEERDPPGAATPVTFPNHPIYTASAWNEALPPPKLRPLFSRILRPTDVAEFHIEALNIRTTPMCSADDLLPPAPDQSSYLPSLTSIPAAPIDSYANAAKADGVLAKKRKDFEDRVTELRVDNDTGYRVINRTIKPAEKPARLAYLRKFWEGLETMSPYWDTSLDQYYEGPPAPPAEPESLEKGFKRPRLDTAPTDTVTLPIHESCSNAKSTTPHTDTNEMQAVASSTPLPDDQNEKSTSETPEPKTRMRYKGRRTASGRDMPDQFRVETVRAFVESVAWAFHCAVAIPRQMPVVQMNTLNLPVRQSAAVYRVPEDRVKARSGWLIGPALTVQVRSETDFDDPSLTEGQHVEKARLDLIRELGGLLQCAQERRRQGKTEIQPGKGKWWTEKPRWGGGPGGEVENQAGNSDAQMKDVVQMAEEMLNGPRERGAKRRPRKTPAMLWKELKCGSKLWDPKTDYEAIGKDPSADYDEIFMVSALNHHISILRLTIHTAYTEYLSTEKLPVPLPEDPQWSSPLLRRTPWFDLFDVDQRVEAFRVLWGIMSYLTREMEKPVEGKPDGENGA